MSTLSALSPRARLAVLTVAAIGMCGQSLLFTALPAALPAIAAHFGGGSQGAFIAQMVMTVPSLGFVLGGLFAGRIVDRFGIRAVITFSLILYALLGATALVIDQPMVLLAARLLQGLANTALAVACLAFVLNRFDDDQRNKVLSWQGAATGATGIAAVFIGGLLVDVGGWRLPFALYPLLTLPVLLLIPSVLPARDFPAARIPRQGGIWPSRGLWGALLILIPINMILVTSSAQIPFLMFEKGILNPIQQSLVIGGGQTAHIPGALLFPLVLRRFGDRGTLIVCFALLGLGLLGCAVASSVPVMLGFNFIFALAVGLLMPFLPYFISGRAGEQERNSALGFMTTANFLGIFFNPPMIALLRTTLPFTGIYYLLGAMLVLVALAIALSAIFRGRQQRLAGGSPVEK